MHYFTPKLEDLHVGYKVEILSYKNVWESETLRDDIWGDLAGLIDQKKIRIPYLNPEFLKQEGWEFKETRRRSSFDFPDNIYQKKYSDAEEARRNGGWMMDGYNYIWTLYIPSIELLGSFQGVDIIIEQERMGGFMGSHDNHSVYWGPCDDPNFFKILCKKLRIRNYTKSV